MKKVRYCIELILLLIMSACSEVDEFVTYDNVLIKLTQCVEETNTRSATQSLQSSQIAAGEKVGVTITGASFTHENVEWTAQENGELSSADNLYYGNGTATIYAYHPFDATWNGTDINDVKVFCVQEDQSQDAGYLASDLLYATKTSTKSSSAIPLTFKHKLSKVIVTLTTSTGISLDNASVYIGGTNLKTGFKLADGSLVADGITPEVKEIKVGVTTSASHTVSAVVVPQLVASGTIFLKVVLGEKTFVHTLKNDLNLESGVTYNYTISINQEVEPENQYLNITALSDGVNISTQTEYAESVDDIPEVKYSFDKVQWEDLGSGRISLSKGQTVYLKGNNESGFTKERAFYTHFVTTGSISADGNIMSLLYGDDFIGKKEIPCDFCFNSLFFGCNLKHAPILPATVLKRECYRNMFFSCWELAEAPELPATTLAESCYSSMFYECTSLVNAPELPATTLAESCYASMFASCWNLEKAPVLPAQTLVTKCYASMFGGCEKLNEVKAYFTSTPVGLSSWLSDTAENGTLYLSKDITWDVNNFTYKSNLNIPDGWTIVKE